MDERMVDAQFHGELVNEWIRDRLAEAHHAALVARIKAPADHAGRQGSGPYGHDVAPLATMARLWRGLRTGLGRRLGHRSANAAG